MDSLTIVPGPNLWGYSWGYAKHFQLINIRNNNMLFHEFE